MLPLAKEIGSLSEVENMTVRDALAYKSAIGDRAEFEEYYYWLSDKKREAEKERGENYREKGQKRGKYDAIHDPNRKMKSIAPEKDKKKVEKAMQSANNYMAFMQTRGYTG